LGSTFGSIDCSLDCLRLGDGHSVVDRFVVDHDAVAGDQRLRLFLVATLGWLYDRGDNCVQ